MARALASYQRALAGRDHLLCYADEGQLEPGGAAVVRAPRLRLRHRLRRRARARARRRRATPSRVVFSGVGKTRAEMRARARRRRPAASTSKASASSSVLSAVATASGRIARVSLRVNPDVDAEDASLHLDRPARQQVRHRPRRARSPPIAAPRSLPGLEVVGHRLPHRLADRRRSSPTSKRSIACSIWSRRSRPKASRSRHIDVGGGLGITYADETPPPAEELVAPPARAHRRARPRPSQAPARAGPLAGRQRRRAGQRGALPEARRDEELLHRRRGDERPDAPGDVRRLDARSSNASAARRGRCAATSSGRSANRATGSAATAPLAVAPGDFVADSLGRRLRDEHGEQLQHARPRAPR